MAPPIATDTLIYDDNEVGIEHLRSEGQHADVLTKMFCHSYEGGFTLVVTGWG